MKNYEKVAELQRKIGEENTEKAIKAIYYLYEHNKLITVKELMQLTGLSRSYFYKNKTVNKLLKEASVKQGKSKSIISKEEVFNRALEDSYRVLEKQVISLKNKNKALLQENEKLREDIHRLIKNQEKTV